MRRSLLFIPSNAPAMLQNADVFAADAVIFDLEDSVIVDQKDAANVLLKEYLQQFSDLSMERIVRINGLDTPFFENDLELIVSDHIDTLMIPKASYDDLLNLSKRLDKIEKQRKMHKKIQIIPIIELAKSLIDIDRIASLPRVNGLLLGAEDLATDLEVERTEIGQEIFYARSRVVIAAKANQIDAIDTPYTHTDNLEGLVKDATFAKSLGMNAKACIHPNQIDEVNRIFSPSLKDINYAKKVLLAQDEAIKNQKGAFSVDGKMIDKPIIMRCEKIIEKAKKWGLVSWDK
ncbi:MAG: CoA ester lyase [Bacillota bacterium]|nr:MAG: CoA ester lyase [Bacillota bacterium]